MDHYGARLKMAAWGWMERAYARKWDKRLKKDRVSGRAEKRGAKNEERRERRNGDE